MKRTMIKDFVTIAVDRKTRERFHAYIGNLGIPKTTSDEALNWLIDIVDNLNRTEPVQPLHTPEEWAQEYKKWRDNLSDEELDAQYQMYLKGLDKNDKKSTN